MNRGEKSSEVVITGIGMITPFGSDRETSWAGLLSGRSATDWVPELEELMQSDDPRFGRVVGAPAQFPDEDLTGPLSEPVIALAVHAAREAVRDANLDLPSSSTSETSRIGCVIGTSKGGLASFHRAAMTFQNERRGRGDAGSSGSLDWLLFPPNMSAATVSQTLGLRGPCLCPVAACATGLICLQRGYDLIRDGYCDVVIAGSSDASLRPEVIASYRRLGVLASCRENDDPATSCKPFDRERSGFVIGEGAGIMVMERKSHAEKRNANMYAEWLAGGVLGEGFNITQLAENPETLVRLIRDVLANAQVASSEIDYCNLHGTATIPNDTHETAALKMALGESAYSVSCSSLKGGIGHLLGAAGSVETAATLLAMRDGVVPPTVNLMEPDSGCDLNYTPGVAKQRRIETALKLSLGFGGHLAAAVVRAV
jgi:3-oxoacyl-[acyl-carrier-protein] synthase II